MHNQLPKEIIELIVKNSVIANTDTLLKCNIKIKILYFACVNICNCNKMLPLLCIHLSIYTHVK